MSKVRIEIVNRDNEKLVGILHKFNRKKELVLVCHGFASDKDKDFIKPLCQTLNKKGLNCFRFDFSGCGESQQGRFENSSYTKQADDLKSIIDHFCRKGYRIKSVIGHSMGGTVAILRAASDRRIESLVAIAPRIFPLNHTIVKKSGKSIDQLIESVPPTGNLVKPYPVSREYLVDIKHVNVIDAVKKLDVPFLLLHGTEDKVVDIEESRRAFEVAYKPKKLIEIKGADHKFSNSRHTGKMIYWAAYWPRRPLKPRLVFLFFFLCSICLTSQFQRKPLPLEYDHSWMVFTLFSMLSLQYVEFTNRLKGLLRGHTLRSQSQKRKVKTALFYLQWTNLFFIITVIALGLRIGLLSFWPDILTIPKHPNLCGLLLALDWFAVASFIIGTILRLIVFIDSYGDDLLKRRWRSPWPFVK